MLAKTKTVPGNIAKRHVLMRAVMVSSTVNIFLLLINSTAKMYFPESVNFDCL